MALLVNFVRKYWTYSLCILGLFLGGCQSYPPGGEEKQPVAQSAPVKKALRVGLLLPLTGTYADLGQDLLNAAQLAFLKNPTQNLTLVPFDTKGTPQGTKEVLEALKNGPVDIIIGPLTASETKIVKISLPQIPVFSFSNDKNVAGENVFILGMLPETQIKRLLQHFQAHNPSGILLIATESSFGHHIQQVATAALARYQLPPPHTVFYTPKQDVNAAFLEAMPLSAVNAILIPESTRDVQLITGHLAAQNHMHPHKTCYGLDGWRKSQHLLRDPNLKGCILAGPDQTYFQNFQEAYITTFGKTPPPLVGLAYDAVNLIKWLSKKPEMISLEAIRHLSNQVLQGVYGPFQLRPQGITERSLALYTIEDDTATILEPAK